ncbi:MAG TPA: ABC transporter permease, partial [Longimicrobiaceae bacterium]
MRASPDVEASPPEPLPDTRSAAAATPLRGEAITWSQIVTLVLAWGLVSALAFLSWGRITGMPGMRRVPLDMYVAVATLALMAVGLLLWTLRGMARRRRAEVRVRGDSQWAIAGRHFRRNRMAMAGLAIMVLLYVVTLVTPLIAPYDPAAQGDIVLTRYLPPSGEHLMGTDKFGRDIFSRVLYGARISLSIGFIAVGISVTLGTLVGAVGGYFGGWVDGILMRFTDMMLSFPRLVLLIVVIALFEPSIWLVVTVLGLTGWMGTARIVRGEVLSLREREFVQAARALGMGDWRIIFRHVV